MDTLTTILKYGNNKNCMLVLLDSYLGRRRSKHGSSSDGVVVYEADLMRGLKAYFSVLGKESELSSGDTVQLNAWYANKLGLKDGEPLPLRRIKTPVARAKRVRVEPVSPDDWEILESNAGCVEMVLLDQVRVVWQGQILPVWINRSICVYMKISSTEPGTPCVILEKNTEVVVAPKVRASTPPSTLNLPSKGQYQTMNASSRNQPERLTNSSEYDNVDILEPRPTNPSPVTSPRQSLKRFSATRSSVFLPMAQRQSSLMESVMKYIFPYHFSGEKKEVMDNLSDSDKGSVIDFSMKKLPSRNGVLRVQPMTLSCKLEECFPLGKTELNRQILSNPIFGFRNQIKKPLFKENVESPKYCSIPLEVFHPSTVYVDAECIKNERFIHPYLPHLPNTFIARLQRLPSPLEKTSAQKTVNKTKPANAKPADPLQADTANSLDNVPSSSGSGDQISSSASCYVRVVAIDRKAGLTDKVWQKAADQVLSNQPLLYGHVVIPDMLRRHLRLETTSSVWIQTGTIELVIPRKVHIYILSNLPKTIGNDLVIMAFINYIKQCANEEHPMVVFQGIFLKFVIFPEKYAEVQLVFFGENDPGNVKAVTMLSEVNIDQVQIVIERDVWEDKLGVVNSLLAYRSTNDIDAIPFSQKLRQLGGVDDLAKKALHCLHASLASTPLSRESFQIRGGLSHGILLITGPRGSGKSSLVHGLCRKMAQLPVLAHIALVDCKQLRGKPVAAIQKNLEMVFDESAWREPAIVILENLDIIVPAPSGPETEMTAESLYFSKIAQVLEGLIRYEVQNNSRVAVIATSISRSSLHPSLISSRGVHCIQQMLNIDSPDKDAREKILQSIIQRHSNIDLETVKTLDIASVAVKTEGFVARDLELLVNRTLHARMSKLRDEFLSKFTLTSDDFEETMSTFKPVSVRNVPLHKAGDLGWTDVGGLGEVKKVLMETLRWPTKYPQLFSSCPLRLRSGILLYGAPGTGKTLLAGVVAKECGLNFISVKGPELLNKYIGASEQSIRDLFTKAQSAKPCILFFDEFDSIAPKRGHDSTGVTDRVVNQLLTQLDGVEGLQGVYVLAATSRPDLIDPALLRPGRLDVCQYCAMPDVNERSDILVALTYKMSLAADVNLKEVAAACENFTGADLKALLYNAQLNVIHEQTDGDRSLNESVVWIKGDSNQGGATMRRASVVKEAGTLRLNMSQSISVNSLGDRFAGDVSSPRFACNSSGNSSGGKTPKSPHFKNECRVDGLGDADLIMNASKSGKGGVVTGNFFQYTDTVDEGDQVEAGSADQVEAGSGDQIEAGSADQVEAGPADQVEAGSVDQVEAGSGDQVEAGSGDQVEAGSGDQVEAGSGDQVEAGSGDQVEAGSQDQVEAGSQDQVEAGSADQVEAGSADQVEAGSTDQVDAGSGDHLNHVVLLPCSASAKSSYKKENADCRSKTTEGNQSPELLPSTYPVDEVDNGSSELPENLPLYQAVGAAEDFYDYGEALRNISDRVQTVMDSAETKLPSTNGTTPRFHLGDGAQVKHALGDIEADGESGRAGVTKDSSLDTGDSLQNRKHISAGYRKKRSHERMQARGHLKHLPINNTVPTMDIKSPSKDRVVTVFTSLQSGLATLTAEDEARYVSMVKEIQQRDWVLLEAANAKRRTSLKLESRTSVLMEVCQRHLLDAAKSMRPSVSSSERARYMKIYGHFVSSRKVGFEKSTDPTVEKRATLA